ncbi:MAG TPA: TonB family protein [Pyrinomonadaceae bacterium]|nr:TonB family protein [Pyrinomonadaceae bacterium]
MFNNLIESSSHTSEIKRRGSFMLFTAVTYVLLFVSAGVISIYAYDASLSDPSTELELISLVPPTAPEVAPEPLKARRTNPPAGASKGRESVRPVLIDNISPQNVPKTISAIASPILPAHAGTVLGPIVVEPSGSGTSRNGGVSNSEGNGNVVIAKLPEPPPAPTSAPAPKKIIAATKVLNSEAISLPKPPYPTIAKQVGAQGAVNVQVLIDESGRVISAKAISGNPLLKAAAQQAATQARFSPTMLGDQAVKVSGVITYNFVLK